MGHQPWYQQSGCTSIRRPEETPGDGRFRLRLVPRRRVDRVGTPRRNSVYLGRLHIPAALSYRSGGFLQLPEGVAVVFGLALPCVVLHKGSR